jgi:DNA repair photolyase
VTSIIYESAGRAREYSELAANLYRGCDHGCLYCYAPRVLKCKREEFDHPSVRKDCLKKLEKDAKNLSGLGETRSILLSFTTDPYNHLDEDLQITRKAIEILHQNGLEISLLTKGGKRSLRDLDLLSLHPELSQYGTTLVFSSEEDRARIEPGAAPTGERIECLKIVHDRGIYTYVSLEPVWDPDQTLKLIELSAPYVDLFKIGTLNYNIRRHEIDWSEFLKNVISLLSKLGKNYYIKKDLEYFREVEINGKN